VHAASIFLGVCNGRVSFEFCETDERTCWHSYSLGEGGSSRSGQHSARGGKMNGKNYYFKQKN